MMKFEAYVKLKEDGTPLLMWSPSGIPNQLPKCVLPALFVDDQHLTSVGAPQIYRGNVRTIRATVTIELHDDAGAALAAKAGA